jgi:penicillin-binding protein 1C
MTAGARRVLRRVGIAVLVLAAVAAVDLARPLSFAWFARSANHVIVDRWGTELASRPVPGRGHELWVSLDQIAPQAVDAVIASEDRRFYSHLGVDLRATLRAGWASARAGRFVQGGSTLSQQTARLLAGRPPGLPGKVVEAWRAIRLDAHRPKDEILTWYLNRAYFGRGVYGIEAAARDVFGESARSLSLAEAALLVGVLPAPERLHPRVDLIAARAARDRVLDAMVAAGRVDAMSVAAAKSEPMELRRSAAPGLAPHLVARLYDAQPAAERIVATVDASLQRRVEALVAQQAAQLSALNVRHLAVLVMDVPTAEVLAYVGSADWAADDGQVDAIRALRSPGSALKPFVYGLAFEAGWRPSDVVFDIPSRYPTTHGTWAPENYDRRFRGPLRLREALGSSVNLPVVRLLEEVGESVLHQRLASIGFDLPEPTAHYGLGLGLGDAEVTLEALTAAYAGLARSGAWLPARTTADRPLAQPVRFLDPGVAAVLTDVLADPVARAPVFGRRSPLERPYFAAVKTGTSTGYRDNWTVGYAGRFAVGVWAGNFDGSPMGDVTGVTGAGPLWAAVLDEVTGMEAPAPEDPAGWVRRPACALSGGTPGPHCVHVVEDWAPAGAPPRDPCSYHTDDCTVDWPPELVTWARDAGRPLASGEGCTVGADARIQYPPSGTILYIDPRVPAEHQRVPLRGAAAAGTERLVWSVNGEVVAETKPGEAGLWQPKTAGSHRIELSVDGALADRAIVEVRGSP